jgi:transcriptional antiterminator NusG
VSGTIEKLGQSEQVEQAKAGTPNMGDKHWYVVHTYSGYEQSVRRQLEERIRAFGQEAQFGETLVPSEQVVELVKGKKRTATRNLYPGYVLVQMELTDETWHTVTSTPKVTGFVGGSTNPPPVPEEEVKRIAVQLQEGSSRPKAKVAFEIGEAVKVIDGPFADFSGVVEEVRADKGTLKVAITIFGRSTSVEMELVQVEKM